MYKFVYYFIYNQQLQKGKSEAFARGNGSLVAALAVVLHLELLFTLIRKVLSNYYSISFNKKEYQFILYALLGIFALSYYWFKSVKRTQRIMDKLVTDRDPTRTGNVIKVIAIIFIPLIVIIILAPRAN
jgi:uncharacterized membrane protein